MNSLNWKIRDGLNLLRDNGRLNLLIALMCHSNARNRCWPSMRLLVKETGWSIGEITKAKDWLIEHGAIELVPFDKRMGKQECALPQRQHIYQLTGEFEVDGKKYQYFMLPDVSQGEVLPSEISRDETEVIQDISKTIEEKPLSPATQDDSEATLPTSVNSTQETTVTDDTVTPAKVKPAKKTCRLLKRDVASQLVPVLFKYGKGRTLESFSQSEVTTIMRNQFTPLLKALQPLDDEHPIDAMELDAAFRWFRKQYKDASYPCGAKTVATMLVNYRAYKRSLQVPKAHLVTPAIDGLLAQPAPRYADSIDIEDVRIIGETK